MLGCPILIPERPPVLFNLVPGASGYSPVSIVVAACTEPLMNRDRSEHPATTSLDHLGTGRDTPDLGDRKVTTAEQTRCRAEIVRRRWDHASGPALYLRRTADE